MWGVLLKAASQPNRCKLGYVWRDGGRGGGEFGERKHHFVGDY